MLMVSQESGEEGADDDTVYTESAPSPTSRCRLSSLAAAAAAAKTLQADVAAAAPSLVNCDPSLSDAIGRTPSPAIWRLRRTVRTALADQPWGHDKEQTYSWERKPNEQSICIRC